MPLLYLLLISIFWGIAPPEIQKSKGRDALWEQQLAAYVSAEGIVNYAAWKKKSGLLSDYIQVLQENPPQSNWPKAELLAYWINAYNALTVQLILKHYPIKSIQDIRNPWKQEVFSIGKTTYTLDAIEHDILRKMEEPRIHFAINCASTSCPKLAQKPYSAIGLEAQLQKATKDFLCDPKRNKITTDSVYLSKIFLWFGADFGSKKERLEWISKQTGIDVTKARIRYFSYDWSLNE
jgi:hypothetical protein